MFKSSSIALLACLALLNPAIVPAAPPAIPATHPTVGLELALRPDQTSAASNSRIAGNNRYSTAGQVASRWSVGTDVVFVALADTPAALLASAAAVAHQAPLLYTRPQSVPEATLQALEDLAPRKIVVVGSASSVSDSVVSALGQIAQTERAWSSDVYNTAPTLTAPPKANQTAYLVSPSSPDALVVPAAAARDAGAVLLTPPDQLHARTAQLLSTGQPEELVVVGGQASVSDAVAQTAATAAGLSSYTRVYGPNRYDTSALLAERVGAWETVIVTNGELPVDALVAGPLAGRESAPLLVTRAQSASASAVNLVTDRAPSNITVVGGESAVSPGTLQELVDAASAGTGTPPGEWGQPTWQDEFNGTAVDPNKWRVRDQTYLGYDWGVIEADAATVQNGMLRIRMEQLDQPVVKADGRERYWTTGYLDSIGLHEARYGRWEVRAKIPTAEGTTRGVWPAFWLRNGDVGEIDIMEAWGGPEIRPRNPSLHNTSRFTVHESTNHTGDSKGWEYEHQLWPGQHPYNTSDDFHVWAVEYTPDYLKAYLDDELAIHITPGREHVSGVNQDFSWVWGPTFDSPWNMRMNLQMGNDYGTPGLTPSPYSVMPADFLVDYVRYYALPD